MKYLSKSDFKLASTCPQKLLYKKAGFPLNNQESEFLQILAEGGYLVGKMAKVMYEEKAQREGFACSEISTGSDHEAAVRQTEDLLRTQERLIVFEPAIRAGQQLVRIDILIKDGNNFHVLEVKAKSHESYEDEEQGSQQKKKLKEYIEDVAYQKMVLQEYLNDQKEQFPDAVVKAGLLMPDKKSITTINNLASWFRVTRDTGTFERVRVDFLYPERASELWESGDPILKVLDVDDTVEQMMPTIRARAELLISYLNGVDQPDVESDYISGKCFSCEFKNPDKPEQDGYARCLGKRAYGENHISELYHATTVGGTKAPLVNTLLKQNVPMSIFTFQEADFSRADGTIGSRGERQLIQYQNTREHLEYFSDTMVDELSEKFRYPLHFIDFETLTPAIPHHKGMSPYEMIAFQWSCDTISHPGATPVHSEWINSELGFPNFKFAEHLMQQIGEDGTPLMWATHENTVLRTVLRQLDHADQYQSGYTNPILRNWLIGITKEKDTDKKNLLREGRLVDMNKFTFDHYFHPYMKGKTSIKKTLPAVWNHQEYLYTVPYFTKYYKREETGTLMNPYDTLKYAWEEQEYADAEKRETVKEGTGAMRAYQDMLFGKGRENAAHREQLKQELLNYCALDTMAMVIIWYHWKTHATSTLEKD